MLTIVVKDVKCNDGIAGLSNFDESPGEQLSAVRVQLHTDHHGPGGGALLATGNHHLGH